MNHIHRNRLKEKKHPLAGIEFITIMLPLFSRSKGKNLKRGWLSTNQVSKKLKTSLRLREVEQQNHQTFIQQPPAQPMLLYSSPHQ
jgi:hypothetical protein